MFRGASQGGGQYADDKVKYQAMLAFGLTGDKNH
jgi:hypothetical protein